MKEKKSGKVSLIRKACWVFLFFFWKRSKTKISLFLLYKGLTCTLYMFFFSFQMYSYNNSLVSLNKNNLSLISVILHHRLFFFYCYDLVWYKELDLKPYWSQVCTVGWRYKTWTPFWTRHLDPFFIPLWTTLWTPIKSPIWSRIPFLTPYFSCHFFPCIR